MKNKITFKDLGNKGKEIKWHSKPNVDNTHTVTLIFDYKNEITLLKVPSQYVKEDGEFKKKKLNKEESEKLIDRRMQSLLTQIQQAIFTVKFYGGNIDGYLTSGKRIENGKA